MYLFQKGAEKLGITLEGIFRYADINYKNEEGIWINRYALFVEGKIYLENSKEFSLTDKMIETLYPEPCIIICYSSEHKINPDILVKDYRSFVCLSYHNINKILLNDCFMESNKNQYEIV